MKRPPNVTTIDFETDPIQARPDYPPKPVGVSIRRAGERKSRYYAWGHRTGGNTHSYGEAQAALAEAWDDRKRGVRLLFQNAQFDVDVAVTHMGVEMPEWYEIDDTMFLLFLWDPHAPDLKLKPSAERILGKAPSEQEAMEDWLWQNKRRLKEEFPDIVRWVDGKGRPHINSKARIGALVSYAPGSIAGRYACGDTDRTLDLFRHLWPRICDRGMEQAYDRERQVMPILLENEKVGVRVDVRRLSQDVAAYEPALASADAWLRKRLKAPSLNIDSDSDFADALSRNGIVRDEDWTLTATGARSVSKNNLHPELFTDQRVARAFGYRNRLVTCLNMFMRPWLAQAQRRGDGYISTNWNQVRQPNGGTRTGRPSTTDPNFLNLSKTWDDKNDGYFHPAFLQVLELPLVRIYVLPDKGGVFLHRDFDGQELRILGHFEDGPLMRAYQDNPHMDVHNYVGGIITTATGLELARTNVKITNFRRIYGGGAPALMAALRISKAEADEILRNHANALPGVFDRGDGLIKRINDLAKAGEPIITWGGREYFVEDPKVINGRMVYFFYKLLNYLIQGSAADATKEAMIRYHNHPARDSRFMVQVYDEINISSFTKNKNGIAQQMGVLRECMEGLEFDVPMLSSGKTGPSWGELTKYKEIPYGN